MLKASKGRENCWRYKLLKRIQQKSDGDFFFFFSRARHSRELLLLTVTIKMSYSV